MADEINAWLDTVNAARPSDPIAPHWRPTGTLKKSRPRSSRRSRSAGRDEPSRHRYTPATEKPGGSDDGTSQGYTTAEEHGCQNPVAEHFESNSQQPSQSDIDAVSHEESGDDIGPFLRLFSSTKRKRGSTPPPLYRRLAAMFQRSTNTSEIPSSTETRRSSLAEYLGGLCGIPLRDSISINVERPQSHSSPLHIQFNDTGENGIPPREHGSSIRDVRTVREMIFEPSLNIAGDNASWIDSIVGNVGSFASTSAISPQPSPSRQTTAAHRIPTEVFRQIFENLGLFDFHAARMVGTTWWKASMDFPTLLTQLRRGGYAAQALLAQQQRSESRSPVSILSFIVSRECALSNPTSQSGGLHAGFVQVTSINFSSLKQQIDGRSGMTWQVSDCCRFCLIAKGKNIHYYSIDKSQLQFMTSVSCGRPVLAMSVSMGVNFRQHVLAALLMGRKAALVDFIVSSDGFGNAHAKRSSSPGGKTVASSSVVRAPSVSRSTRSRRPKPSVHSQQSSEVSDAVDRLRLLNHSTRRIGSSGARYGLSFAQIHGQSSQGTLRLPDSVGSPPAQPRQVAEGAALEPQTASVRHYSCKTRDIPISVAASPTGKSFAFGTASGMELHWIDRQTDQDHVRWIPQNAPSDQLHFLPRRVGIDAELNLRLLSSRSLQRHMWDTTWSMVASNDTSSMSLPVPGLEDSSIARTVDQGTNTVATIYHAPINAVPLCDGHHVLYTDPETHLLCLSTFAPVGHPSSFFSLFQFVPPESLHETQVSDRVAGRRPPFPTMYRAATTSRAAGDPTQVVRIAVAYDDILVLYTVPPDAFASSPMVRRSNPREEGDEEWTQWWPDLTSVWNISPNVRPDTFPFSIRGVLVGTLEGIQDVSVEIHEEAGNSGVLTGISIWAFGRSGKAVCWQVGGRSGQAGRRRVTELRASTSGQLVAAEGQKGDRS